MSGSREVNTRKDIENLSNPFRAVYGEDSPSWNLIGQLYFECQIIFLGLNIFSFIKRWYNINNLRLPMCIG